MVWDAAMVGWTLLTNHGAALVYLAAEPHATIRDLSLALDIHERTGFRVMTDLCAEGYLVAIRSGRRKTYAVNLARTLPDPLISHRTVGDLLTRLIPPERLRAARGAEKPLSGSRLARSAWETTTTGPVDTR